MSTTIRGPDENDAEWLLLWTLLDQPESEQPEFGETRTARAACRSPCGFVIVLLRALSFWPT